MHPVDRKNHCLHVLQRLANLCRFFNESRFPPEYTSNRNKFDRYLKNRKRTLFLRLFLIILNNKNIHLLQIFKISLLFSLKKI